MFVLLAQIALAVGLIGIGIIFYRKIPLLVELSKEDASAMVASGFSLKGLIAKLPFRRSLALETILQKILSPIRVLFLRAEKTIAVWLETLRTRAQQKKLYANDSYWLEIKEKAEAIKTSVKKVGRSKKAGTETPKTSNQ